MCGISGLIKYDNTKVNINILKSMTAIQKNRGPDDEGYLIKSNWGIGHCRLSIIDLSNGKQPMSTRNKSIHLIFNGEIFNYKRLRQEVENFGYNFQTNSDTEVILLGYDLWGKRILDKLNGMFVFAILDSNKNEVFIARDRFGIKPLYYLKDRNQFGFSTNINSLKYLKSYLTLNSEILPIYFSQSFIPCPDTIYREVKKLPPAHYLVCNTKQNHMKLKRYWTPSFIPAIRQRDEMSDILDQKMNLMAKNNVTSDVPFGAFLSGGIDSTLILDYVSSNSNSHINAYNINFHEENYSEEHFANYVSKKLPINLISKTLKHYYVCNIEKIIDFHGEPFGDSSILATHYVSKIASKDVKMVISGDGGDELFCGYAGYYESIIRNLLPLYNLKKDFQEGQIGGVLKNIIKWLLPQYSRNSNLLSLINKDLSGANFDLLNSDEQDYTYNNDYIYECHNIAKNSTNYFDYLQIIDLTYRLSNDFLAKVDIASMHNSIEARPILLDNNILDFALSSPLQYRANYKDKEIKGKPLLKYLLHKKGYKNGFINRNKKGFTIPLKFWFKKDKTARVMLEDYLQCSVIKSILNTHYINYLIQGHDKTNDNSRILWLTLVICTWLEKNRNIKVN